MKKCKSSKMRKCSLVGVHGFSVSLNCILFFLFAAVIIPAREIPPDEGFIPVELPHVSIPEAALPCVELPKINLPKSELPKGEYL